MQDFHKIVLSKTTCYLLGDGDGFLLIDCGGAGQEKAFLSKLGRLGLTPLSIRYLLLTHHHSDHCGLLDFLLWENPDMTVIMSRACAAYMKTGRHVHPTGERYAGKILGMAMRAYKLTGQLTDTFRPYNGRPSDIIVSEQGGRLPDAAGFSGRLLYTPGHTGDSLSLIAGGDAFVGDAARNMLRCAGAVYEPILYDDRAVCFNSWSEIVQTGVKMIHPSHGNSFPADFLKKNRAYRKARFSCDD